MSRLCLVLLLTFSLASAARSSGGGSYGRGGGGGSRGGYGTHSYPSSNGYSGNSRPNNPQSHAYPSSTGLSGNRNPSYHRSEVHHHYHYSPPQQINYGSQHFPVYNRAPPVYVYEYRNSGSRFDTLLTGLALYNLGRMSSHHSGYDNRYIEYRSNPGEMCKLKVTKTNGEYEETRIDCKLMSSFIWDEDRNKSPVTTQFVTNTSVTTVNNVAHLNLNASGADNSTNSAESVISITNTTTIVDALQVKGPSLQVQPGMDCYMIRISRDSHIQRKVDCGILQNYAVQSLHYNKADGNGAMFITIATLTIFVFYSS